MKAVRLTDEERKIILHALKIAAEDGSIYPTTEDIVDQDESIRRMSSKIEAIERKLLD